jgi:hypothetical protein
MGPLREHPLVAAYRTVMWTPEHGAGLELAPEGNDES